MTAIISEQGIDLLRKALARIEAEPQTFDMLNWVAASDESPCGTTACLAGHVLLASGQWEIATQEFGAWRPYFRRAGIHGYAIAHGAGEHAAELLTSLPYEELRAEHCDLLDQVWQVFSATEVKTADELRLLIERSWGVTL